MKAAIDVLFKRRVFRRSEVTAREIDEELRFHLELLTREHLLQAMSPAEAKDAAVRRFGNVEHIRDQCLAISRRRHPLLVGLRAFLIIMFFAGVVVRTLDAGINVHHLGDLLIVVPILGHILLYVRGLNPSRFLSKAESASPLRLNETPQPLFTVYDRRMLTPVERLISDK